MMTLLRKTTVSEESYVSVTFMFSSSKDDFFPPALLVVVWLGLNDEAF